MGCRPGARSGGQRMLRWGRRRGCETRMMMRRWGRGRRGCVEGRARAAYLRLAGEGNDGDGDDD
eukprot:5040576-Pyramimonas_sp.AAC.1